MLSRDGTTEGGDEGQHRVLVAAVRGGRGDDVHVHVPVGDVAEGDDLGARVHVGDHGRRPGCEPHPLRGGHRDIELDRDAQEPGRLRVAFPVGPEPGAVGRRFRDGRVPVPDDVRQVAERAGPGRLEQEIRRCRYGQRRCEPGVPHENLQAGPGEELGRHETRHLPDRPMGQRVHFVEAAEPGQHGHHVPQPGHEPQPGLGDHGQGALGPGEQGRVVVAGVVLDQPGQVRHDGAVREDRFDAAQLRAHRPVAQDAQPAGVGRHGSADGGAVPAGDEDPQIQARVGVRHLLQGDSGPGRDLGRLMVDRSELVQPGQAQHELAVQRHAAADQAGVSSLRDDGQAGVGAQCQHGRDLGRITGPNDRRRMPPETARPVHGETGGRLAGQDVRLAHDASQRPEQRVWQRHHSPLAVEGTAVMEFTTPDAL